MNFLSRSHVFIQKPETKGLNSEVFFSLSWWLKESWWLLAFFLFQLQKTASDDIFQSVSTIGKQPPKLWNHSKAFKKEINPS